MFNICDSYTIGELVFCLLKDCFQVYVWFFSQETGLLSMWLLTKLLIVGLAIWLRMQAGNTSGEPQGKVSFLCLFLGGERRMGPVVGLRDWLVNSRARPHSFSRAMLPTHSSFHDGTSRLNEGFTVFLERKVHGRLQGEPERQFESECGYDVSGVEVSSTL